MSKLAKHASNLMKLMMSFRKLKWTPHFIRVFVSSNELKNSFPVCRTNTLTQCLIHLQLHIGSYSANIWHNSEWSFVCWWSWEYSKYSISIIQIIKYKHTKILLRFRHKEDVLKYFTPLALPYYSMTIMSKWRTKSGFGFIFVKTTALIREIMKSYC